MSLTLNTVNSFASPGALASLDPLAAMDKRDRILLVDDSKTIRKMFSSFLSPRYECVEAGSFDEAMSELRKTTFSLVITDIIMPGMSGIELLRKVLADYPDTSVIIASGVDRPQRALDAIRLGAFDYLIKPCEPDVLRITVERALERRDMVKNAHRHKLEMETWNAELVSGKLQLERLQTQIVQNAKMAALGQLAAGVAHELNNPVGFVHANLEMLDTFVQDLIRLVTFYDSAQISPSDESEALVIKKEIRYPAILEEISSIIRDCREGADRIRDISLNLRTFSRLDEAEFMETDIHEGLDATIRMASQYFSSEKIVLVRDYGDLPHVGAFAGQLNQVWMNLIVNAAQAIGKGNGEVRVGTTADDDNIWVEVKDTGCGIAVQNVNQIFDPFYTTKPVGEGTGLGLSISYGIIERHGGTISVNTQLNEGTTFKVRLPRYFEPEITADEKSIACYVNK